jgi:hypothetical protein
LAGTDLRRSRICLSHLIRRQRRDFLRLLHKEDCEFDHGDRHISRDAISEGNAVRPRSFTVRRLRPSAPKEDSLFRPLSSRGDLARLRHPPPNGRFQWIRLLHLLPSHFSLRIFKSFLFHPKVTGPTTCLARQMSSAIAHEGGPVSVPLFLTSGALPCPPLL